MKNTKTSLFLLLLFIPMLIFADGAKGLFNNANKQYEQGNYDSTIILLDSIVSMNLESAELYYNLGNAWYKKGEIPKAILYYEKAKKLEPNNPDINYNLALANTKVADKIEAVPEFFLKTWWKKSLLFFNEKQWMYVNIISYSILLIFLIIFFTTRSKARKQFAFYLSILFLFLSIISGVYGYNSSKLLHSHNTAIVFTPTVNVKSSPNDNANTIFVIHQGTKVQLMDKLKNWHRIKLANGSIGWISESDFEKI
ncbi:MAG: hypothetical protein DSY76_00085 [Bacteroidetes bacterium]|nr:MAG: hypothetical protein DSY76_00085 [Bacteroidota bacterium]